MLQPLPGSTNGQEESSWETHCSLLVKEEEGSDPILSQGPFASELTHRFGGGLEGLGG